MEIKQGWERGEPMIVASVSSLWVDYLGGWKEGQKRVGVWLAPEGVVGGDGEGKGGKEKEEESVVMVEGKFFLRLGEEGDVEQVSRSAKRRVRLQPSPLFHRLLCSQFLSEDLHLAQPADIFTSKYCSLSQIIFTADRPHPRSSMLPLLPFTSVASIVTPNNSTSTAWIVTKEDLSLGLLFTDLNFRRQGLAKRVVEHRIAASREMGRPFCHVELDNEASSALWKGMGWELGWVVGWVYM